MLADIRMYLQASNGRFHYYTVLVTSYLCFYAELLSRHSEERRLVEFLQPTVDHLQATCELPRSRLRIPY